MWRLLKAIGGRGRGPNRRSLVVGQVDRPSRENWAAYLAKKGFEGGCSAVAVENGDVQGTFELGEMEGVRDITAEEIVNTMKTMKSGKAVPRGRLPKEVWQVAMGIDGGVRRGVEGTCSELTRGGKLPKKWQEATAFQLDKRNGKPGCPGIRLINLLCPMGKAVFKHLWRRLGDSRKPWAYGFVRNKCREMALGVVMTIR